MKDLHFLTLAQTAELIRNGTISPVAVTEACLERTERLNSRLNAFITVLAYEARVAALEAEKEIKSGKYRGPLHGIPVAFKDMYDTAGVRTTAAFEYFKARIPARDAVAVQKLKAAGAILIGKTNMHELAMGTTSAVSFFGAVKNPWNVEYIAGGSSGGSAAAVAAGMCYATVDTDAIGSTRLPAACCGIVGYKCTWGLIDNTGVLEGEQADEVVLQLAAVGIMARSVIDIALVADALTGSANAANVSRKGNAVVGVVENHSASQKINQILAESVRVLEGNGLICKNTAAPFSEAPDMKNMMRKRKEAGAQVFKDTDLLLLPTLADEVPTLRAVGNESQGLSPQNTFFVNYFGLPAISVPCGFTSNGLPTGLQFVGKAGEDAMLFQIAKEFEDSTDWKKKHPPE